MTPKLNLQPQLENEFIKLVPLEAFDFEKLYQVASDPLIWEQHPQPDRYKREVFQVFFDGAVTSKSAFLVYAKRTGALIGSSRFYDWMAETKTVVIGYTYLTRDHWGTIYNQALKKLMLNYAFQFVEFVFFHIGANNIRSQKAIVKLGAHKTREFEV